MKTFLIFLLGLLFGSNVQANQWDDLPLNCLNIDYSFQDQLLILGNKAKSDKKQTVYLIQNTGNAKIWLNHEAENKSASAGWATELESGKWTALSLAETPFDLACVELRPGAEQFIACETTLKVCKMQRLRFMETATGSYWLVENVTIDRLYDALEKRGIVLESIVK